MYSCSKATATHYEVGSKVRKAIEDIGGTMPEDLPRPEKSIKQIEKEQLKRLKNLKEIIYSGVCADLCVMDFARTNARFLDQINKEVKLFVVKNTIDTFDAPGHNREEWLNIAYKVMEQAGIEIVENVDHLIEREKQLGLYLR